MNLRTLAALALTSFASFACVPGGIEAEQGAEETSGDEPIGEVGEMWGPCPIDEVTGIYTLCNSQTTACVPADSGTANMCLPIGSCGDTGPSFGASAEVGWGNACYARCEIDDDCASGMVCGHADSDGGLMCSWPFDN
jgi:hypothetical protein